MRGNLKVSDVAVASASRNSAGQSNTFNVDHVNGVLFLVDVTVNAATLEFFFETSVDGSDWYEIAHTGALPAGISKNTENMGGFAKYVRIRWTISGGSATFAITKSITE